MLTSKSLMKNAIRHFPRWMDIRKRTNNSTGGLLLDSMANEVSFLQSEIDQYIMEYFVPYYEDKCDTIIDFIYKADIGEIGDVAEISLVSPQLSITDNIKDFYGNNKIAYYQDGFLFIKESTDNGVIFYSKDDYVMEAKISRMHTWNVYDEFAVFVGIERYENESNKELYNRIINTANRVINSSEKGLKNAILAGLCNIVPELNDEDIVFERPTASNLVRYYSESKTILEELMSINKDVLRCKSWDLDKWEHDFADMDYVPNQWDITLDNYTNGIGDNDDLKPILINATTSTDAALTFYQKSEELIDRYIQDKKISEKLTLPLKKYNNVLEPYTAKYKVTASEAIELNAEEKGLDTVILLNEASTGDKTYKVDDIIEEQFNMNLIEGGTLKDGKFYRVKFTPSNQYDSMEIYSFELTESSDINTYLYSNLMNPKGDFSLDGSTLKNNYVKKSVTKTSQYVLPTNVIDTSDGIIVEDISKVGTLELDLSDCENESMYITYSCDMTHVLANDMTLSGFYYDKETRSYKSDIVGDEKSIKVSLKANAFKATIPEGQCMIIASVNGTVVYNGSPYYNDGVMQYSTDTYSTPQDIEITIISLGSTQVEVSELLYNKFELSVFTKTGMLMPKENETNSYVVPNNVSNKLYVNMKTFIQYSPVLERIFIGRPLSNADYYESDIITGNSKHKLSINSNCTVELYESSMPFAYCDKSDPNQLVTYGYDTNNIYIAKSNNAYINLDTSKYTVINSIKIDAGTYELIDYGNGQKHAIKFNTGESISEVTINGSYEREIARKTIHQLIEKEFPTYDPKISEADGSWSIGDKVYLSRIFNCFVIKTTDNEIKEINITLDSFDLKDGTKVSSTQVLYLPESLQAAFTSKNGETISIGREYEAEFATLYFYPRDYKEYIAFNEYTTYLNEKDGINIANTFHNGYTENSLMAYKVMSTLNDSKVTFSSGRDWSIGTSTLIIKVNRNNGYNITSKTVNELINLGGTVNLKESYITESNEYIELAQYIIDTTDSEFDVVFKHDVTNSKYEKVEFIDISSDGFNKLRYSNVHSIKYIGQNAYDSNNNNNEQIDPSLYELDKEKGIITWLQNAVSIGTKLCVAYTIKIPVALKFKSDYLYKKAQYPVSAYQEILTVTLKDLEDGRVIDMNNPLVNDSKVAQQIMKEYRNADVIYVSCSQPGFEATKDGDYIQIRKIAEMNSVAIKSGWYYLHGREYYLFATDQSDNIINDEYITLQEVSRVSDQLSLHKKTSNYVSNTKMISSVLAETYKISNFNELTNLKGSSDMSSITACESYNHWKSFFMDISIQTGLNGSGLYFRPTYKDKDVSYAMLEITDYVSETSHLSFYNPLKLKVYLGKSVADPQIPIGDSVNITAMHEISAKNEDDIYYTTFSAKDQERYYLIVRGEGLLDDIILHGGNAIDLTLHKKNITLLNLDIEETSADGMISRVYIDNSVGNDVDGTEIDNKGYIVNTSSISWNSTKIKTYKDKLDWTNGCILSNLNIVTDESGNCAVVTENLEGKITTKPINIGDPKTIKNVIMKINNLPIEEMQGCRVDLYQGQTINGSFYPCELQLGKDKQLNYASDIMYPYIKLSVEIPKFKVIENIDICLEHISTDANAPVENITEKGQFISEVYDSRSAQNYVLKSIGIEDVLGDVSLFIRGSKADSDVEVWTDWKDIKLDDDKQIRTNIAFDGYRYFQIKVALNNKDAKIKLKYFDLEVV